MGIFTRKGRPFRNERVNLEKIAQWFIQPLFRFKPEQMSDSLYLEMLFHSKERSIHRYEARSSFLMPGLNIEIPNMPVQGLGYRTVNIESTLFVRHDTTRPNSYQISFMGGQGEKEQVFELTAQEWGDISRHLENVETSSELPLD
jgi:hypothetical protein